MTDRSPSSETACSVERLLTYREAGRLLGVTERTISTLVKDGMLPAVKFGGSARIDPTDLRAFIEASKRSKEARDGE